MKAFLSLAALATAAFAAAPGAQPVHNEVKIAPPAGARRLWSEEVIPPPPHWFHSEPPFPINLPCPLPVSGNISYYEWESNFRRLAESPKENARLLQLAGEWVEVSTQEIIGARLCIKDLYLDHEGRLLVSGCIRYRTSRESGEIVKCFFYVHADLLINSEDGFTCGDSLTLILNSELYLVGNEAIQEWLEIQPITIPLTSVPGTGTIQADLLCILAQLLSLEHNGGNGGMAQV